MEKKKQPPNDLVVSLSDLTMMGAWTFDNNLR